MKSFRTIKKNAKALSPVVASIILIAVTVAVSVVVAAWMGGMSVGLMGNAEQVTITNIAFDKDTPAMTATIQNIGNAAVEITQVYVTGPGVTGAALTPLNCTIPKGTTASTTTISITGTLATGNEYTVKLVTSKANTLSYAQVMP